MKLFLIKFILKIKTKIEHTFSVNFLTLLLSKIELNLKINQTLFSVRLLNEDIEFIEECYNQNIYGENGFIPINGGVCLDIGANIGACSLAWYRRNPNTKIFAFEPHPETFARLKRNVDLNSLTGNIVAVHAAIGSGLGMIDIGMSDTDSMAIVGGRKEYSNIVEVPCLTIDHFLNENNVSEIDICKIDVEGFEIEVLRGMSTSLSKVNKLVIEYHSLSIKKDLIENFLSSQFNILKQDNTAIGLIYAVNVDFSESKSSL